MIKKKLKCNFNLVHVANRKNGSHVNLNLIIFTFREMRGLQGISCNKMAIRSLRVCRVVFFCKGEKFCQSLDFQ